jgi:phospholipase/lecithinase/hemolysin
MFQKIGRLFAILFTLGTAPAFATTHYSNIFVFGDSLSDTGNYASISAPFSYPYWNGSFSNGPVAVETLAEELSANNSVPLTVKPSLHLIGAQSGTNYSVAGARASTNEVIDLSMQVHAFLIHHQFSAPNDALYIVFIGGNDLRAARDEMDPTASSEIIKKAVTGIDQTVRTLAKSGAKHFLVVNAPNLGAIPETQLISQQLNFPLLPALTTLKTQAFNARLYLALLKTQWELKMPIAKFNLFVSSEEIVRHAKRYDIENTSDYCFSTFALQFNPSCLDSNNVPRFDSYFYFDEIHPTAKVHKISGERMAKLFAVSRHPVPQWQLAY